MVDRYSHVTYFHAWMLTIPKFQQSLIHVVHTKLLGSQRLPSSLVSRLSVKLARSSRVTLKNREILSRAQVTLKQRKLFEYLV